MFRAIWTKTLRELRVPILGWGLGLGLSLYANYATARDAIASGVAGLAEQFRFMAEPVAVDTVPGYVTFRVLGLVLPVLLSVWAILAGARLVGDEEEHGSLDVLLSTPRSRARLLAEKLVALAGTNSKSPTTIRATRTGSARIDPPKPFIQASPNHPGGA